MGGKPGDDKKPGGKPGGKPSGGNASSCDTDKTEKCIKDAGVGALVCETYSGCIKDNGCCDEEMTDDKGTKQKASTGSATICALTKSDKDKCKSGGNMSGGNNMSMSGGRLRRMAAHEKKNESDKPKDNKTKDVSMWTKDDKPKDKKPDDKPKDDKPKGDKMPEMVAMGDKKPDDMGDMKMFNGCGNMKASSSLQFIKANLEMHDAMAVKISCKHDVDFVRSMIPHHSGAIVMCDILAANTKDKPDVVLNELCANITRLQRAEITWMAQWLMERKHKIAAPCCKTKDAKVTQPPMPCEDILSSTSFCHSAGGDFMCKCKDIIKTHPCGSLDMIKGFAVLNTTAECQRTCGGCPGKRAQLFSQVCPKPPKKDVVGGDKGKAGSAKKVIVVTTTLKNLDYNKIIKNATVKKAVVQAITDAYLSKLGAGYTAKHIAVTLSSGSVKAEVKITPASGTDTGSLKTVVTSLKADLETAVLTKVKAMPAVTDFVEAGKTLADVTATSTAPAEAMVSPSTTVGSTPVAVGSCHSQWSVLMFILLQVITFAVF